MLLVIFTESYFSNIETNRVWRRRRSKVREREAEQGKQHKDPEKGTAGPELSVDRASICLHEFCKAVKTKRPPKHN